MRKLLLSLVVVIAVAVVWFATRPPLTPRPDIPFAALQDENLHDPDNPTKLFRVDFAKVENEKPLLAADRAKLTPENLKTLSQEEVDQIYARLTAGPIPDGFWEGGLFFENGKDGLHSRLGEILGGVLANKADAKVAKLEKLGRTLWLGKRFYRDERVLRNAIEDLKPLEALIDEPAKLETIEVPRHGLLAWVSPRTTAWLMFPAKLYCGQSLLDGRRESVIIDYAYTDDIKGFMERPDSLAGRRGISIRDEIRMVRPGFYLGRAYANRAFLLNFTLYDAAIAEQGLPDFIGGKPVAEDCWPGEQGHASAE